MSENNILDVNVDIVLCIDATGSMAPVIEMVKESATSFYDRLGDALLEQKRDLQDLRMKVIAFRDLDCDGAKAIEESRFFSLPEEKDEFKAFVMKIRAEGGGDAPETTLDVIAHAMHSEWGAQGSKKRHVIMVWTDAPTKPPTGGRGIINDSVNDMGELYKLWQDAQMSIMDKAAKRLVVFAPDHESWENIQGFEQTTFMTTDLGRGMGDLDLNAVLAFLSKTL